MLIHSNSIACIAGSIVGAYEIKFWQWSWQEILPQLPGNLAILNAAHFYDLIDFIWSQLNQPILRKAIVLHFVVVACMADNREFGKGDAAKAS